MIVENGLTGTEKTDTFFWLYFIVLSAYLQTL